MIFFIPLIPLIYLMCTPTYIHLMTSLQIIVFQAHTTIHIDVEVIVCEFAA
jgi:hypothetical protein